MKTIEEILDRLANNARSTARMDDEYVTKDVAIKSAKEYTQELIEANKSLYKEILELRSDIILQDEDYKNLQGQMAEERSEMHSYIRELRQYEE
jgi:hypothetical protein